MDHEICTRVGELLSDYLDDELGRSDREVVRSHLDEFVDCAETLAAYRRVVGKASALDDRAPAADLWPAIAHRIGARVPESARRIRPAVIRRVFRAPQLLAAGIGLAVVAVGAVFLADEIRVTPVASAPGTAESPVRNASFAERAATRYDAAIADLQSALDAERESLDPETVRVVEENLAIIDRALERARQALRDDPDSDFLREHVENTQRQKLELLQQVTHLASEL